MSEPSELTVFEPEGDKNYSWVDRGTPYVKYTKATITPQTVLLSTEQSILIKLNDAEEIRFKIDIYKLERSK